MKQKLSNEKRLIFGLLSILICSVIFYNFLVFKVADDAQKIINELETKLEYITNYSETTNVTCIILEPKDYNCDFVRTMEMEVVDQNGNIVTNTTDIHSNWQVAKMVIDKGMVVTRFGHIEHGPLDVIKLK